ncbi:D-alanyl-D-alanine carboxypeptidase family protein [Roseomonas sp. NAR14]|uniref:D-alanyl-D-alanine carboxypeptidase family protein n=1 Tax=Roseomonas acroporae TaxID=2937791 RepID=A0A9X2BY75_9PROT|nr:D-alanyl-D-alanine carboxypeptidase family protein [Roseomonas acroporae]MCK8788081.1 D-alanyl-D-alanine carboxypeptidase family protein [Roseomonas acroporae]
MADDFSRQLMAARLLNPSQGGIVDRRAALAQRLLQNQPQPGPDARSGNLAILSGLLTGGYAGYTGAEAARQQDADRDEMRDMLRQAQKREAQDRAEAQQFMGRLGFGGGADAGMNSGPAGGAPVPLQTHSGGTASVPGPGGMPGSIRPETHQAINTPNPGSSDTAPAIPLAGIGGPLPGAAGGNPLAGPLPGAPPVQPGAGNPLLGQTPEGAAPAAGATPRNGELDPASLVSIGGPHRLTAPAATAYQQMIAAAREAGFNIAPTDSYRTLAQQQALARRKGLYSQGGYAAAPGTSRHGLGEALDLGVVGPDGRIMPLPQQAQAWLQQNGGRFGFETIPREPWHWQFRGAAPAGQAPGGGQRQQMASLSAATDAPPAADGMPMPQPAPTMQQRLAQQLMPGGAPAADTRAQALVAQLDPEMAARAALAAGMSPNERIRAMAAPLSAYANRSPHTQVIDTANGQALIDQRTGSVVRNLGPGANPHTSVHETAEGIFLIDDRTGQPIRRLGSPVDRRTVIDNTQRGETVYSQERGRSAARAVDELEAASASAGQNISRLNMLERALGNLSTGPGAATQMRVGQLAQRLGIPDETLAGMGLDRNATASAEVVQALSGQILQGMIGPGGIPANNFSNADREALERTLPGLGNSPAGNRAMVAVLRATSQRQAEIGEAWRAWQRDNGADAASFRRFQNERLPQLVARDVIAPLIGGQASGGGGAGPGAAAGASGGFGPGGRGTAEPGPPPLPMMQQGGRSVPDAGRLRGGEVYTLPNGARARFDADRQTFIEVR